MTKNKKILLSLIVIIILLIGGYFIYNYFNKPDYTIVEEAGLNNISGIVESIEGDTLQVLAQVPDKFTPFSEGAYEYVNRRYTLKTTASTVMLIYIEGDNFEQLINLKNIKPNTAFSAVAKENIMTNNELELSELIIYK